jgi:pyruvate dehydrogenase E2 component (dihydrolipoamide acetyltransferase)
MEVKLPKIGETADSGTVASILVKVGDTVEVGQTLIELEQEKAVAPIASTAAGVISAIHVKEGQKISVGTPILSLGGNGPTAPASPAAPAAKAPAPARRAAPVVEDDDDLPIEDDGPDGPEPAASPYVRKVARELGIKLGRVAGSGPGGRVVTTDLARYVARLERGIARAGRHADEPKGLVFAPVNQDFSLFGPVTSEPLSQLRKIISARMVENKVSLPHVTQFDEADMSRIEALRKQFKAAYEAAGAKLTPTPFIIKALVNALKKHPKFNASVNEVAETLVVKHYYHVGIAVDTEAGLLVPVLRDADKKSLLEIAKELAAIAEKARDRKVGADDMKGGTFTISNQGAIGGGHFTPIINKPEVAILGIGKTSLKPVVLADGKIEARPLMPLTVSYDHRVIDGGAAARFTVDLVKELQEFAVEAVAL